MVLERARRGKTAFRLLVAAAATTLAGCPLQIDDQVALQMLDDAVPTVSILSPSENSVYSQTVTVSGSATDPGGSVRRIDYVVSGALGVLAAEELSDAAIAPDGTFSFTFGTVGFTGPLELRITATDWNDNTGTASVSLQYSGSQLSSFAATAGNRSVSLDWEPLPEADSYTIYYTDNGTLPGASFGTSVAITGSSYELSNLKNGALHIFLLSADVAGEPVYWSNYVSTIPLSQFTLAPRVTGGYRRIELEWPTIAGSSAYEVYRATNPDGPFTNYTGTITGNAFTDTGVDDGTWYYYQVKPALPGTRLSTHNGAQTVSIPVTNEQVATVATPAATKKVAFSGSHAYVAAGAAGLLVFDVGDPGRPRLVGSIATTDATDVAADGTTVFVADGTGGVLGVDASNPASPRIVGTYAGSIGNAARLALDASHDVLAVVDTSGGTQLALLDVRAPESMGSLSVLADGTLEFVDVAMRSVEHAGQDHLLVYVPAGPATTGDPVLLQYRFTVASPGSLAPASTSTYTFAPGQPVPAVVTADEDTIYALSVIPFDIEPPSEYQLWTFSGYPSALTDLGASDQAGETRSGYAADLVVAGDRAFAVDEYVLTVYDVTSPSDPSPVYTLDTPGSPLGVATDGDYAYVAPGTAFFQTVDLNLPATPSIADEFAASSVADVRVRGNRAYVTARSPARLRVINLADPGGPSEVGSVSLAGAEGVAITGDYAVIAGGSSGITVVDLSDETAPIAAGSAAPITGSVVAVEIVGDHAFAAGAGGLQVYDIADPASPVAVALLDSDPGGMKDITIRGSLAYVVDGAYFQPTSLKIVDIANPAAPALRDSVYGVATSVNRVAVAGDYAYVTDELGGVTTVNVNYSSGDYLTTYGPIDPGGEGNWAASGVAAFGDYVFVSSGHSGLTVIDAGDPANQTTVASSGSWGGVPGVARLYGGLVYVAAGTEGLKIVRLRR